MIRVLVALLAFVAALPAVAAPAMWRIHDADTEIVLFGSMHELPKGIDWLARRVTQRLDAADTLVLELVFPDDPTVVPGLVSRLGYSPAEPRLLARVAPSKRAALTAAVAATRLSMDSLDLMDSWLAAITLDQATLARLGLDSADGVEAVLTARARGAGKPVIGLETVEQQLGYFDGLSETDQRRLLDGTVDDIATAAADTRQLTEAWAGGDTDRIAALTTREAMGASPEVARVLMTDRNARWADWLAARLQQPGKVFVAVGAAHLAGPQSVVAMLQRRGIAVERLP